MKLKFFKYQATGNDFIIVNNREYGFDFEMKKKLSVICKRRFFVGADGIIFIEEGEPFSMLYLNSDGSRASICGNGARSVAKFAIDYGIVKDEDFEFNTDIGSIKVNTENGIWVLFPFPEFKGEYTIEGMEGVLMDSGVPHFIVRVEDVEGVDVVKTARKIRFSKEFKREGVNVDFIDKEYRVRVYERGVEEETLSCGSGAVAITGLYQKDLSLRFRGGILKTKIVEEGIYLGGDVKKVFEGEIDLSSVLD